MRSYLTRLIRLLPQGWAWRAQRTSQERATLQGLADELQRADDRAEALLQEIDPRTATEMLLEWERELGLPDPCSPAAQTQAERRAAIVRKLTSLGGQSAAYFETIAAVLGYDAEVQDTHPFQAGRSEAGDAITNDAWLFHWILAITEAVPVRVFKAGIGAAGEPLRSWGNDELECVIGRLKPAHTTVGFTYGTA